MGDIGDDQREYIFEPLEVPGTTVPVEPAAPAVEPEVVPA